MTKSEGAFGVFSLSSGADKSARDPGVDSQGRAVRQRRYHSKSRQGCTNCKSRKVKCDETRPTCRRCSTRGISCVFEHTSEGQLILRRENRSQQIPSPTPSDNPSSSLIRGPRSSSAVDSSSLHSIRELGAPGFDLQSLQLMYHFEHFTADTLLFEGSLWRDLVLPLGLQHEYLMHAILTVSASHLHYLQPQIRQHSRAAVIHLDHALSGFRARVSGVDLSQDEFDVVIACGFILLHYAWSVPFFNTPNDESPNVESDGLLWFAVGVKEILLAAYGKSSTDGIFQKYMKQDHVRQFYAWSEQSGCSYDFDGNFLRKPRTPIDVPDRNWPREHGNANAGERLAPIFRAVDAVTRGQDISDIMPSILAYWLMWPSKAMQAFQDEVRNKRLDAMVTMLSFYACSWFVLSDRIWWAHHRSKIMCEALLAHLGREELGGWNQSIGKITEYFAFNRKSDGNWEVGRPAAAVTSYA